MTYDYIIAGAGAAGCILANRLSACGKYTVLLLEAGGKDSSLWFKIPVGFAKMYYNPTFNWMYYSQLQKQLNNREIYAPRGKVQGGSGSINAMIYVRGQAHDFDDWAANGNDGWGFKDVLPYFRKLENHPSGESEYHGGSGLISITPMKGETHPICDVFLKGCDELGYPQSDDFNGPNFEGSGIYDVNTKDGRRSSSSFAHLHPALSRPNLTVEHYALVDRVLFENVRASGISVTQHGVVRTFQARKEVILCAGAVDTPKILQLSGVADQALLAKHQIPLVKHLPAVGQNLQDHLCVSYYYKANIATLNDQLSSLLGQFKLGLKYLLTRKGALAMSVNQAGGFFRGNESQANPNLQLYFNPLSYQIPKNNKASLKPEPYSGFLLCFNPCRPTSRGHIEIQSNNPRDAALIDPNYLSTQKDIDEVIQGSRLMRKIMQAPALKSITVAEVLPGPAVESDEQMLQYFRENSGSIYHLCGSCAMGADVLKSVVDKRLKVHGLDGLRIVDASIFPNVTSGNTHAAVLMVAEKGADLILQDA
ncbi:GMC family oxidoreductase N-terminal domain-containing protein [Pseudomonas lactis]|uniref:GMC family oxidoreductase n=1 Tax=Pseudomonas lactis TaxID=1615674 RepID=UPI0028578FBD|nr:GMC family oxidoreductase N-terminal domain-containing protein [Pseudomonas lactis]MDR8373003.1 GMC family oxidoreductase N-terminal domain-containing protein [Pseudomonas lactis]